MSEVRFIHSADFHLDAAGQDDDGLVFLRRQALTQVVDRCTATGAQLLFLAGDLWDQEAVRRETLTFIRKELARVPKVRIFIAPGNHDAWGHNKTWTQEGWSDNVHIFSDFSFVELPQYKVRVYGAGFTSRWSASSLLPENLSLDPQWINVLVMHGEVGAPSDYNPMPWERLVLFDYCALGHRHEYELLAPPAKGGYPGSAAVTSFRDSSLKGCLQGVFREGTVHTDFYPLHGPLLQEMSLPLRGDESLDTLEAAIVNLQQSSFGYLTLRLTGRIAKRPPIEELTRRLQNPMLRLLDETREQRDYESLAKENSLRGIYTRRLLASEDPLAQEALEAGLDALEGEWLP
ncbi:hypothetical protein ABB02_00449 [Clostridiaceae bacterium JG1575]|nr:hypothetical protein ABB02_00449 [Clostridiaceae bacterium JG1575]